MKRFILLCLLFSWAFVFSQTPIKAITDTGDEVLLYSNGNWKYVSEHLNRLIEIPENSRIYERKAESTFLLKSKVFNVGVWLDPKIWKFQKAKDNPDAEYEIDHNTLDFSALILTEDFGFPLESMRNIAFENAVDFIPDIEIINQDYRTVNGQRVLHLEMAGTYHNMPITYYGYYFANDNGTVQLLVVGLTKVVKGNLNEVETLLNGLVEL